MNRIRSGLGIATARTVGTMTSLNFQHPISLNFTSPMPYEGTPRVGCHMTTPSYSIYISRSNLVPLRRQKWGRPCVVEETVFLSEKITLPPESSWLVCCRATRSRLHWYRCESLLYNRNSGMNIVLMKSVAYGIVWHLKLK